VKMGQLIEDLLAFSRLGRKEMLTATVNMHDMAKNVFDELISTHPSARCNSTCSA